VSDIALKKPLPPELAQDMMAYVGCVAGAISIDDYRNSLLAAGFPMCISSMPVQTSMRMPKLTAIRLLFPSDEREGLSAAGRRILLRRQSAAAARNRPATMHEGISAVIGRYDLNEYAASVKVYALKQ